MEKQGLQLNDLFDSVSAYLRDLPNRVRRGVVEAVNDYQRDFQKTYRDSGIQTYIDDYVRRAYFIFFGSILGLYLLSLALMSFFLRGDPWWTLDKVLLTSFATILIGSSITAFMLIYYPYYRRGEGKRKLEEGLIYFLSYMAVLSASGMPIERILERITEVEDNPPLIHLSKKFLMNVKLFGMNVRTALKDIADMSPSHTFAKQLEAIRTVISTSGDLKTLLTYEVDRQLQVKRESLKSKLNSLVYLGEIYVAMMVITPILFVLVIAILSILGGGLGGSAIVQLDLLVFVGIPILSAVFLVLLDQTMGTEE